MPKLTGTPMIRAMVAVISVPKIGTSAPNSCATGSQEALVRKPRPKCLMAGVAPWISESRMAASRASTRKAKQRVISRNSGSRLVRGFCVELDS